MNKPKKLAAILGGGDWTDASVELIIIPSDMNLDEQKEKWNQWYFGEYCPTLKQGMKPVYISFVDFLKKNGARDATDEECLVYFED